MCQDWVYSSWWRMSNPKRPEKKPAKYINNIIYWYSVMVYDEYLREKNASAIAHTGTGLRWYYLRCIKIRKIIIMILDRWNYYYNNNFTRAWNNTYVSFKLCAWLGFCREARAAGAGSKLGVSRRVYYIYIYI